MLRKALSICHYIPIHRAWRALVIGAFLTTRAMALPSPYALPAHVDISKGIAVQWQTDFEHLKKALAARPVEKPSMSQHMLDPTPGHASAPLTDKARVRRFASVFLCPPGQAGARAEMSCLSQKRTGGPPASRLPDLEGVGLLFSRRRQCQRPGSPTRWLPDNGRALRSPGEQTRADITGQDAPSTPRIRSLFQG